MTGSGMGCPDWPKCFGQWIPPTEESALPDDYRESFAEKRSKKIDKFADFLDGVGFGSDADMIRNDESLREKEEPFNATKTWIEYINRLLGFLAGNLVLTVFLFALFNTRIERGIVFLAFFNLILILFQAWFGSMVVATNLLPWTISVHMVIALLIVGIQIHIIQRAKKEPFKRSARVNGLFKVVLFVAILASLSQIVLGTQVRQEVDVIAQSFERSEWISQLGVDFEIHRTFAILVLVLNGVLFFLNWRYQWGYNSATWLMLIVVGEALAGIILSYAGMPAFMQPVHLMFAAFMFGFQVKLLSMISLRR